MLTHNAFCERYGITSRDGRLYGRDMLVNAVCARKGIYLHRHGVLHYRPMIALVVDDDRYMWSVREYTLSVVVGLIADEVLVRWQGGLRP